jgi:pimeloyl-ACP methyl ester carboxylesterase
MLATYPERMITATLGGAGWMKPNDERMAFMAELADSLDTGKGIGPLINQLTPAGRPKPTEEELKSFNQMLTLTNDPKALAACIRGMTKLNVSEEKLRANKVPTLAIIGEIDPLKVGVDELAKVMPGLKVDVIAGADHMTAFRDPKFANDLLEFLAAHSKSKVAVPAGAAK